GVAAGSPGGGGLEDGLAQGSGAQFGDLLVLGVGDHAAERLPAGVADDQDRVPGLSILGDQGRVTVAGVEQFGSVPLQEAARLSAVLLVGGAAAGGEAQQVQHDDGAARVLLQQTCEVGACGVDCHVGSLVVASGSAAGVGGIGAAEV